MTPITRNTRRPMVGRRSARILAGGSLIVCLFAVDPFLLAQAYDGVIDFDAVLRDPAQPTKFAPKYDAGDHLHPNDAGYELMANTINLEMLAARPAAPQTAGR